VNPDLNTAPLMVHAGNEPAIRETPYSAAAAALLSELDSEQLAVELVPAPRPRFHGHMVRMVFGANPHWYRKLAAQVPPRGRPSRRSTGIRRAHIRRALQRLASGRPLGTAWEALVLPVVEATAHQVEGGAA